MKSLRILLISLLSTLCLSTAAQVDNYALQFEEKGIVNLGTASMIRPSMEYTIQMWICPDTWTKGAALLRCGEYSIRLVGDHSIVFDDGTEHFKVTNAALAAKKWTHITLRAQKTETLVSLNNELAMAYPARLSFPCAESSIWLGGNYTGRIDEVRLWNGSLPENYDSFWRTTLNSYNPSWSRLVSYWKMDQELCPNLVDYKGKHHGTLSPTGVKKVKVTDNDKFKYLISLGYGNVERYFDRSIDGPHYWLNNRISIIGAVAENSDVRLYLDRDDATLAGGAEHLDAYNKRNGVLSLPTAEARLEVPSHVLNGMSNYTVETWVFIDEWQEGAFIFRHENSMGTKGISLRLGSGENLDLIMRCDGRDYLYGRVGKLNSWFHVGFSNTPSPTKAQNAFQFAVNGMSKTATTETTTVAAAVMPNLSTPITFGEGLVGKLDEIITFSSTRSPSTMNEDRNILPLPGEDKAMNVEQYYSMRGLYTFDIPSEPGFDAFSVQGFFDKMRSYTNGMRGVKFTLTVASNDFDSYLGNATTRNKIAEKIAAWGNDDHFDGIDLDFEWVYTAAKWRNIGLLCQAIRSRMKEGKILSVSPHKVAYSYPTDLMQYVDYFNFQCYGPGDKDLCSRDGFKNALNLFLNYGYPKEKIVMSYSTTTTSGFRNGSRDASLAPQGYRYLYTNEEEYDPSQDFMHNANNGADYWIAGLDQVIWRNQYVVDQNLGGMMYWDIGNDLPASYKHSMARASTYFLNSNVEKLVTEVSSAASAPDEDTLAPTDLPLADDEDDAIKESVKVASLSDVKNEMAYTITNANGLGTIFSNPSEEKLWLGASSNSNFGDPVDLQSLSSQWLLIDYEGKHYLYNIGRMQFLVVAVFNVTSQPCTFSDEPVALEVKEKDGIFTFRTDTNEERGFMCASPQLKNQGNPVCQWTADDSGSQWNLYTAPNTNVAAYLHRALTAIDPLAGIQHPTSTDAAAASPIYDLQGRICPAAGHHTPGTRPGLYIQGGRKVIVR